MEHTISEPLALQHLELDQLHHTLQTLQQQMAELQSLLPPAGSREDLSPIAMLTPLVQDQLRTAQQHATAAMLAADMIARVAEERRQEAHHLRLLYSVGQAINSTLDLRGVLNLLIDKVIEMTQAERGYVVLRDRSSGNLTIAVARGISQSTIEGDEFSISRGLVTEVAMTGRPLVTTNAQADPRFSAMESVQNYQLRAIMCVPLVIRGRIDGVMYVDNRMRTDLFTERQLDLLVGIANQAALAIDNARVFDYLANVLASIASGVVTVDAQGTITTFNRAATIIFGLPAEQAIGQPYTSVFGLLAGSGVPQLVARVHEHGEVVLGHETRAAVQGRGEIVLLLNAGRITAETGERLGIVMVLEDVTQRRRMERYIAPARVEHIITAASPHLGGDLRDVTILFGDVQGYTALSEKLDPQALIQLLNAHLALAASTIMEPRHSGTLDKYMGDAVMGMFNAPVVQLDHAWRAVCAAWAMQIRLRAFQQTLPPEHHLRFRVGVNTGSAVVGNIGSENLMNYTAIGDAVNVAKRLQEHARPGQVVFSEATYTAIAPEQRRRLHVRPLAFVALKGRSDGVPAYELLHLDGEPAES